MSQTHGSWGERLRTFRTSDALVTLLFLKPNQRCSWHKHTASFNKFTCVSGKVGIKTDKGYETMLYPKQEFTVEPGVYHEFRTYELNTVVEEIAYVAYDENDIQQLRAGLRQVFPADTDQEGDLVNYLIIPARYDSTRFPGKPLALINKLPMVVMTYRAVEKAIGFDRVMILTDSLQILNECQGYGIDCVYQDVEASSGTERIACFAMARLDDDDLIVNVQGDEPLMDASIPQRLLFNLKNKPGWVWTAARPKRDGDESQDIVKCSLKDGMTVGFSRCCMPGYNFVHIGVYGYQVRRLRDYMEYDDGFTTDKSLEQLRWGEPLACITTDYSGIGVDRPVDILRVQDRLAQDVRR